jgi:hypothetical protein
MSTLQESSTEKSTPPSPEKENPWAHYSDALSMNEEQRVDDKKKALQHAIGVYDQLRYNDRINKLNGMRNKEIALLCAEEALEDNKGRSIAAEHGADKLGEVVWEHFNEKNLWTFPGRD